MALNKSTGNMYPFVTNTWNTVKGKCPHSCQYCYMKKWGEQSELHFDEKELKTDLGEGNFIFVGSSCDMWAEDILQSHKILSFTLNHCTNYFKNRYLYQSKNPRKFCDYTSGFLYNDVVGTTIETNRIYPEMGNTPSPKDRSTEMSKIVKAKLSTMVTIEPIMDFDLISMINLIKNCDPSWVNIGANTNHQVKLPEPAPGKIRDLIAALSEFTEVKIKKNLNRLLGEIKSCK